MKYTAQHLQFTHEQRDSLRTQILRLIATRTAEQHGVTQEIIYNSYTHKGGLHGLSYRDFTNRYEYGEAKKALEDGQFFTPSEVCQDIADLLQLDASDTVADLSCGMGNFFNVCPTEQNCYGMDVDEEAVTVAQYLYPDATIEVRDLRHATPPDTLLDVVFGNPPFNLRWEFPIPDSYNHETIVSQLWYCQQAARWLKPGGLLALIVPTAWLSDTFQEQKAIETMNSLFSFLGQYRLSNDVRGFGKIETKVMAFQKRAETIHSAQYVSIYTTRENAVLNVIQARQAVKNHRASILLETKHDEQAAGDPKDWEQIVKLRYDISQHPNTKRFLSNADALINELRHGKPDGMTWEGWKEKHVTPKNTIMALKEILHRQGYVKSKGAISQIKEYPEQVKSFAEIDSVSEIDMFLSTWRVYDKVAGELFGREIALTEMQRHDLVLLCQKRWGLIQWDTGCGKTLALLAWNDWQRTQYPIRYTVITSTALAINTTWQDALTSYHRRYVRIRRPSDFEKVQPGDIILLTYDALADDTWQLVRHLTRWLNRIGRKHVSWLCDESHKLTNPSSKRTLRIKAALQRVHYKLFATATAMLNNVAELYPQIEAILNNSTNMLCESQFRYSRDKDGNMDRDENEWYGEPFPARIGFDIFKSCHNPEKITVFGIGKMNQDIYNLDALKRITDSLIITRSFEDIRGDAMLKSVVHTIEQNAAERALCVQIMQELSGLLHYFTNTGNARKEAGLKLIRQINLLIKASSIPHTFLEYHDEALPNKFLYLFKLLKKCKEPVAVGVTFRKAIDEYHTELMVRFPDRRVFVINGNVDIRKRQTITQEFEQSGDGILLTTQQALAESINIPNINVCIMESLQWNSPTMAQFYGRFRRFTSKKQTTVHYLTYKDSIEQNRMALILNKKRMTEFLKYDTENEVDVYKEYGLTESLLTACIQKAQDKDGKTFLTWGQQTIN